MWLRIARRHRPACVNEPLVAYRFHRGNLVSAPDEMVTEARWIAARHGISVDIAAMHRRAAWAAMRHGDRLRAVRHYARAIGRGDVRSLGRAAFALIHPAVGTDRLFDHLGCDREWVDAARRWLTPMAQRGGIDTVER